LTEWHWQKVLEDVLIWFEVPNLDDGVDTDESANSWDDDTGDYLMEVIQSDFGLHLSNLKCFVHQHDQKESYEG